MLVKYFIGVTVMDLTAAYQKWLSEYQQIQVIATTGYIAPGGFNHVLIITYKFEI